MGIAPKRLFELMTAGSWRAFSACPLKREGDQLFILIGDPTAIAFIERIKKYTGYSNIELLPDLVANILAAIDRAERM